MQINKTAIEGILEFSGFTQVQVHPKLAIAHALMGNTRYDFWVQDNRIWLEINEMGPQGQLSVELQPDEALEGAMQRLMDLYLESEQEAEDEEI